MRYSRCASCAAPITWAYTGADKRAPFDADPSPNGTHQLDRGRAVHVPPQQRTPTHKLHTSHFATCPNARHHRRPKGPPQLPVVPTLGQRKVRERDLATVLERIERWRSSSSEALSPPEHMAAAEYLRTGQPYRFRCGPRDQYADSLRAETERVLTCERELRGWLDVLIVGPDGRSRVPLWSEIRREHELVLGYYGRSSNLRLTIFADVVIGKAALDALLVWECQACDGAGQLPPTDAACARCEGTGRVLEPTDQELKRGA